jgi:hypothetical protein
VLALWLAMSDFLDPDRGPEPSGDFEVEPSFFFILLGIGFAIGVLGHITRVRTLVAIGIALIFLATVLLPIALQVSN